MLILGGLPFQLEAKTFHQMALIGNVKILNVIRQFPRSERYFNSIVIDDDKVMKLIIPKNAVGEMIPVLFATTMAIPDSR